ncbi:MATE family efflux transporter [Clostridiisalibacter paucivorans]|uniref:MATE family efflux transporter n=1 Tax=Clostridiisalibacter paucivorans TaxID=408753 RepID=UPI000479154C|nr:MATE family efflux transporter [Clostridiisalibacter paucivorans]
MEMNEKRAKMMGEENISKLLMKLGLPAILAMLVNAIYNVVDTMFVGMLNNTSAIAAVSVVFPIFMLIGAVGLTFGVGAASYISRLLGENNKLQADKSASTAFFSSLLSGIIFAIIGLIFIRPILKAFGATDTIIPYAIDYARILISGSIFTMLNMTMNNMIRAEGNAKYSMIGIMMGAIFNIVLDPIFMFKFNMGIKGAALATVIAQIFSFIYLLRYYLFDKSYVKISIKYIKISKKIYGEIMKIGTPTFARQFLTSMAFGMINLGAKPYGDGAVAAIGITMRVISIGYFVVFGYSQGFQPVAGYNYGARKYERMFESIKKSIVWTTIFTSSLALVFALGAKGIIGVFSDDPQVIEVGVKALKYLCLFYPLFGYQNVNATLFQALGKGREAMILSISRQGLFLMPAVWILPKFFGLDGVLISQPVADLLTIIVTFVLSTRTMKSLKEECKNYNISSNNTVTVN